MTHYPSPVAPAQVVGLSSVHHGYDLDESPFTLLEYGDWSLPMNCHVSAIIQAKMALELMDSAGAAIK